MQEARIKPLFRLAGAQPNVSGLQLGRVIINSRDMIDVIDIKEILYLKAESNYTWVNLEKGTKYLVSKTLKEVSGMISRGPFVRVHKSYYVNLNHVRRYIRGRGGYLVLKDGTQIPVSRSQRVELMRILKL